MSAALLPAALRWAGFSLLSGAAGQLFHCRAAPNPGKGQGARVAAVLRRLGAAYERLPAGRRLSARLLAAQLPLSAAEFRATQAVAALGGGVVALDLGAPLAVALLVASLLPRLGGELLRLRRGARDGAVIAALPALTRHLSTALGSGASPEEAIRSALDDAVGGRALEAVLGAALAGSAVGIPAADALERAASELGESARHGLGLLAATLRLAADGGVGPRPLARLALGLEAQARRRAAARVAVAEARLSAVVVPALAVAVGIALAALEPDIAVVVLSLPLAPLVLGCGLLATVGVAAVRRVTEV